jgi:hypothetical protein
MRLMRCLTGGLFAAAVAVAATGCGGQSKSEAPAQFSANPTGQPIDPGKGGKAGGKQNERGPSTTTGDG